MFSQVSHVCAYGVAEIMRRRGVCGDGWVAQTTALSCAPIPSGLGSPRTSATTPSADTQGSTRRKTCARRVRQTNVILPCLFRGPPCKCRECLPGTPLCWTGRLQCRTKCYILIYIGNRAQPSFGYAHRAHAPYGSLKLAKPSFLGGVIFRIVCVRCNLPSQARVPKWRVRHVFRYRSVKTMGL